MTKPQWRTISIRINPTTRKAVGLQTRIPLTPTEWDTFMQKLAELKHELVEHPDAPPF